VHLPDLLQRHRRHLRSGRGESGARLLASKLVLV
jgi:hypothetical protein